MRIVNGVIIGDPFTGRPWMSTTGAGSVQSQSGLKGIVAGGLTGAMEACISYPTEYVKTQLQLETRAGHKQYAGVIDCVQRTIKKHGILGLYRGMSILIYGSIPKTSIRYGTYEILKSFTQDERGHVSHSASFFYGLGAGCTESVLAVTPMETIKVKMVNDRRLSKPRYHGMFHAVGLIMKEEGVKGIYQGVVPTTIKQGTSQAIRFYVVDLLKDWYRAGDPYKDVPVYWTPVYGVIAGAASALLNTPIDVVKTKMQSLDAAKYKGTWDCMVKIWNNDGFVGFYKGLIPRLLRVSLEVGVTFTLYDEIIEIFKTIWP